MRRIRRVRPTPIVKPTPVSTQIDESLHSKIANIRMEFKRKNGIDITNTQASRILSMQIGAVNIPKVGCKRRTNAKRYKK